MSDLLTRTREAQRSAIARLAPHRARGRGRLERADAALSRVRDGLVGARRAPVPLRPPTLAYLLFAATPLLYIAQQLLTRPRAILGGEMYAEMSSNYYATTQLFGARLQLLAVDAGYIPLPQRIIGLVGWWLGLPPSAIPYYYTGIALVLSALLVGCICLPVFRPLIASDPLRFALAAAILLVLDFETRGYINFTYLAVVPALFVSALAFVDRDVPRWAWCLPVLMISKPAVLTAVPFIVVAAIVAGRRFRAIAAISVAAAVVQVVRLTISSTMPGSLLQQGPSAPLPEKIGIAAQYAFGFLGRFVTAPNGGAPADTYVLHGVLLFVGFLLVALLGRSKASAVVLGGLSLIAADMLLNAVVYFNWFTADLAMTGMVGFDRRVVVAMVGALIAGAGVIGVVTESPIVRSGLHRADRFASGRSRPMVDSVLRLVGVLLLVMWLVLAGWQRYAATVNGPITAPSTDVSKWEAMAPALAADQPVVCVPTAPFGWGAYGRGCESLGAGVPVGLAYQPVQQRGSTWSVTVPVPQEISARKLAAMAILVQPGQVERPVAAVLTVTAASGAKTVFRTSEQVPLTGGALLFENMPADLIERPRSVSIVFDAPVRIGTVPNPQGERVVVMHWMGQ